MPEQETQEPAVVRTATWIDEEPTEYVDRTLATASWYDTYTVLPGRYPVEWVTINHAVTGPADAYYARFVADVILEKSYRENRLLSEVRASEETPGTRETKSFTVYAYEVTGRHGRRLESIERIGRIEVGE